MSHDHDHDHDHGHRHGHGHGHGHANDQGLKGALRYLRWLPEMWSSSTNDAVVDRIAPQRDELVVDVGAGMGAGAMRAAATGAQVVAVEPTPFIRRALVARRFVSRHRKHLDVADGAAEQIPAADGSVDAIWAVNTMHHWVDVERGVAEIARVLKPGGRVLLVDEVFTDPSHPEFERFGSEHGPEHHGFTMVDAEQMGAFFLAAGLSHASTSNDPVADRPAVSVTVNLTA